MKDYLIKSATQKEGAASAASQDNSQLIKLYQSIKNGGTIYIAGDQRSRFSVEHLAEELQVRFRAGSSFGRPDRDSVAAISLVSYQDSSLLALIEKKLNPKDSFVYFSADLSNPGLDLLIEGLKRRKLLSFFIGNISSNHQSSAEVSLLPIASTDLGITFSFQHAVLHALCEVFEPEYFTKTPNLTIADVLKASATLDRELSLNQGFIHSVVEAKKRIKVALESGASLYCIGNGGSACDAEEIVEAFRGCIDNSGSPIVASSFLGAGYLTCAINDGFPLFRRGVDGISGTNALLFAISTSGQSQNVTEAARAAKAKGIFTVGFIGKSGGALAPEVDIALIVPSNVTERIQEVHTLMGFWFASS